MRLTAAEALLRRALLDGAVRAQHVPYVPPARGRPSKARPAPVTGGVAGSGAGGAPEAAAAVPDAAAAAKAAAEEGGEAGEDGEGSGRLEARSDGGPLVDLPSLRLAAR